MRALLQRRFLDDVLTLQSTDDILLLFIYVQPVPLASSLHQIVRIAGVSKALEPLVLVLARICSSTPTQEHLFEAVRLFWKKFWCRFRHSQSLDRCWLRSRRLTSGMERLDDLLLQSQPRFILFDSLIIFLSLFFKHIHFL